MTLRDFVKKKLNKHQRRKLRNISNDFKGFFYKSNLNMLAQIYGTDKFGVHNYTQHYMAHCSIFKNRNINLLEIGVGGEENPEAGAQSLRMWKKYFGKATINAIDIYDKSILQEKRIRIFKGSQDDKSFLEQTLEIIGSPDIIIDDGSHINNHVIKTFKTLFPLLNEGGVYVVEDTQTSYWKEYGGSSENFNDDSTMMYFFKSLVDGLNYLEFKIENYTPSYFENNILSIHFYHNLVFVIKK